MFGQTFDPHDLAVIGLLIVLEGVLSIDNALVLGILAKRLPKHQQGKALTYGLIGAFVFRLIAVATAVYLIQIRIVQLLGGLYLVYISVKHFFFESGHTEHMSVGPDGQPVLVDDHTGKPVSPDEAESKAASRSPVTVGLPTASRRFSGFWPTVAVIELTDIAFAIDSILAAVGIAGMLREKRWVVFTGGMIGVVLMRFAAVIFIKLLEKFPRFETSAYLLVIVIGLKLVVEWVANKADHPHRVDFHNFRTPEFWVFWLLMATCFVLGFIPKKESAEPPATPDEPNPADGKARPRPGVPREVLGEVSGEVPAATTTDNLRP
jgi:YkoY family integral membrane protein